MKKFVIALILVGVIGIALNTIFGWQTVTYLTVIRAGNNIYLYKFNMWGYIENLKNSFGTVSYLGINTPTRIWNNDIINNLALFLDWFLFAIQILLYPFRLGGYIILQLLAILGVNTINAGQAGGLSWLVVLSQFVRDMQIQYI